ncbi:hypothetical protein CH373_14230 [Leptospira perolatii]|uniref:Cytochrome C n=1 Tax=Leptospira perolatii TaxID=2023191 RepID=A0A2M9ZKG6_9LEPT|nr:hypothetical protein [Leptospira perolatii]PJZ68142.1 hypothetical protein CH360_17750 [Leptospira perolatii]PJZ72560.1 hypothetical protein CH373_14230 [Leptospira perolatii]
MVQKKFSWGLVSFLLWAVTFSCLVYFFVFGQTTKSKDGRTAIHLTEDEKLLVLTEMRGLLTSLNGILGSLSEGDYVNAAKFSSASGMSLVQSLENEEKKILIKLPIEFKQLGFGTHRQFDVLAGLLKEKKDMKIILKEMDSLTKKCVACHAAYKIAQ